MRTRTSIARIANLTLVIAVAGWAAQAHAGLIQGALSITGGLRPNTTNLSDATYLDFSPSGGGGGFFRAADCSGDFAAALTCDALFGDVGTIVDLSISPFVPVAGFWQIGPFSFDLQSLVSVDRSMQNALTVSGSGLISAAGFDPTPGSWLLTANQAQTTFSYSASSATEVPEPGPLALLGLGIFGLGMSRFLFAAGDKRSARAAA
jgi:PEP-CTERM motif